MKIIQNTPIIYVLAVIAIPLTILITGCSVDNPTEVEDYQQQPLLQAYIYNGEPVEEVHFEWTAPFEGYYNPDDYAIIDADIVIFPEDVVDTTGTALYLEHDSASPGHYTAPQGSQWRPEGKRTYRIVAQKDSEDVYVTATALVPDTFTVVLAHPTLPGGFQFLPPYPDTLFMPEILNRDMEILYNMWTPSDSTGGYISNTLALTPRDSLVPLDPDFVIGEDELDEGELWRLGIQFMLDDQFDLTFPWASFNWEGPYLIDIMAVSEEYLDYVYAGFRIMMQGISMQMPSNIEGGIGVFGGLCRYRYYLVMERVE